MERVCFYEFCDTIKRHSENDKSKKILSFINEVICPIVGFEKNIVPTYPETTNTTRDIKNAPIRNDFYESIDTSNEDKKNKEMKRLSKAFSSISEWCTWNIDLFNAYVEIKKKILISQDVISIYLSIEETRELFLLAEQEDSYIEFLSLLMIHLIKKIPNDKTTGTHNRNIIFKDESDLFGLLFDFLNKEIFFDNLLSRASRNAQITAEGVFNCNNDLYKVTFFNPTYVFDSIIKKDDFFKAFFYSQDLDFTGKMHDHYIMSDSLNNMEIIQRGFITLNSKIDRTTDRLISEKLANKEKVFLFVGWFESVIDFYETFWSFYFKIANTFIIISIEFTDIRNVEAVMVAHGLSPKESDNQEEFEKRKNIYLERYRKLSSLNNIHIRESYNSNLLKGVVCWVLFG